MRRPENLTHSAVKILLILVLLLLAGCGSSSENDPASAETVTDTQAQAEAPAEESEAAEETPASEEVAEEPEESGETTTEAEEAAAAEDTSEEAADESSTDDTADQESAESADADDAAGDSAVLDAIFYGDTWTWPYQTDALAHLSRGKYYIPVQDDNKIAILDPDAEDYDLHYEETEFVQPHHPWMAPGMRYNWINFQSEGKGDHDVIAIMDTWSDEIVKYIRTGTNDPFHMAFSPTDNILVTADLDPEVGRVHLFDTEALEEIATVETTGIQTRDIVITHDGRYAFIGHQGYDPENGVVGPVDVLDIANQEIVASLGEGRCRSGKMSNDGTLAFYSCGRADTVIAIDTETLEIVKEIQMPEGSNPFNISFRSDDKYAYVGLLDAGQLAVIDVEALELEKTLDSGTNTNSTYFHPYAPIAITTNDGTDSHVTVLDVENNEVIETIETGGKGTHNGQWSPDGRWFLVTNRLDNSVTLLTYNDETGDVEWYDDITVGFGANGVHWAPYFCGVEELTNTNVADVVNQAPVDDSGACPS